MNRLLVVDDEPLTADMLRRFFEIVGYEVVGALTGSEAMSKARELQPKVIILDINLPDIDGYEVCRQLRTDESTNAIPIIFLTTKDKRVDRLAGLELGADDFISKPFDIEELRLRVHNMIQRMGGTPLVDPRTSLPSMAMLKERLPEALNNPESTFFEAEIEYIDVFGKSYGPVASNQAIRSTAKLIGDLLHEIDPKKSFIAHPAESRFLIGLPDSTVGRLQEELPERFKKLIEKFYSKSDLARGNLLVGDQTFPLMSIGLKQLDKSDMHKYAADQQAKQDAPTSLPPSQINPLS
jgi:DNA-binding response OmpR family regulator